MAYYYFNYWVNRSGRRNTQILLPKKANLNDKNLLKIIKEYTSNRPGIKKVIGVFSISLGGCQSSPIFSRKSLNR